MTTDEKSIKKLARIVFKHGYSLGAFSGDNDKMERGYGMMIKHMIDTETCDEHTNELLKALLN